MLAVHANELERLKEGFGFAVVPGEPVVRLESALRSMPPDEGLRTANLMVHSAEKMIAMARRLRGLGGLWAK